MRRRNRDLRRGAIQLGLATLTIAGAACTQRIEDESSRFDLDGIPAELPPLIAPDVLADRAARAGLQAALTSLGVLDADGVSPPAVSPDGRHVAVQLAPAPSWIDLVAWRDAMPSPAPAVGLAAIDRTEEAVELATPRVLREPLLLGRSATNEGVLVESPRPDGSRRVGLASWTTGEVEWLVEDDGVAAMAVLGPDRALAWCRSPSPGAPASLRLLDGDGRIREWPPPAETTWMLPTFSGDGRSLFALLLGDGRARLAAIDLADPQDAIETWALSNRMDVVTALRAVLAPGPDASAPGEQSWLLVHPEWRALCRWHPETGRVDRLPAGSFALTRSLDTGRLLADSEGIWQVGKATDGSNPSLDLLVEGAWIPRAIQPDDQIGRVLLFRTAPSGFQVVELSIESRPHSDVDASER